MTLCCRRLGSPSSPTPCGSAGTDLLNVCAQTSSLSRAPPNGVHGMSLDSRDASACPLLQHDAHVPASAPAPARFCGILPSHGINPVCLLVWHRGAAASWGFPLPANDMDVPTLSRTAPHPHRLPMAGLGTVQRRPRAFSFLFLLPMCSRSALVQLGSGAHIGRGCSAHLGPCHTHYFYNSQAGPSQLRAASPTCAACAG